MEDTGLHLLMVIAMTVTMLDHLDLKSASLVVANQPNDGKYYPVTLREVKYVFCPYKIGHIMIFAY